MSLIHKKTCSHGAMTLWTLSVVLSIRIQPKSCVANPEASEQHAALCLAFCSSSTHIEVCISYICLLHLNLKRYFWVKENDGGNDFVCP